MSRNTDHPVFADDQPCACRRKVILPHMNTIEARREAQVGSIVHDESNLFIEYAPELARMTQDGTNISILVAVLNKLDAASDQFARKSNNFGCAADSFR